MKLVLSDREEQVFKQILSRMIVESNETVLQALGDISKLRSTIGFVPGPSEIRLERSEFDKLKIKLKEWANG